MEPVNEEWLKEVYRGHVGENDDERPPLSDKMRNERWPASGRPPRWMGAVKGRRRRIVGV